MRNDRSDDYRRAHGAVALMQDGLIGLINTGKTGMKATARTIGDPETGKPDDIAAAGTRRGIEELCVLAWKHAKHDDDKITKMLADKDWRKLDGADQAAITKYLEEVAGISAKDPNLAKFFAGINKMRQDFADVKVDAKTTKNMSLLHHVYTQYSPLVNPSNVALPTVLNQKTATPAIHDKGTSPQAIKVGFNSTATPYTESMPYYMYRTLAGLPADNQKPFKARMESFEGEFAAKLRKALIEKNVDVGSFDVRGLTETILRSPQDVAKHDINPKLKDIINATMKEISLQPITIAISRGDEAAEKKRGHSLREVARTVDFRPVGQII